MKPTAKPDPRVNLGARRTRDGWMRKIRALRKLIMSDQAPDLEESGLATLDALEAFGREQAKRAGDKPGGIGRR